MFYAQALILVLLTGCALKPLSTHEEMQKTSTLNQAAIKVFKQRAPQEKTLLLDHGAFAIAYSPRYRSPLYVRYTLTAERLRKRVAHRRNKFHVDPLLKKYQLSGVRPQDYARSGYDRGHLAPAADFAWDQKAQDDTFVMTNMAPQKPGLNRGAWGALEEKVRRWACGEERVFVVTGAVLRPGLPQLPSGVVIPQEFFKVVFDDTPPRKAIAFLYTQKDKKPDVISQRIVSISEIEGLVGERLRDMLQGVDLSSSRLPATLSTWKERDCSKH